jgi:hypothetical protein
MNPKSRMLDKKTELSTAVQKLNGTQIVLATTLNHPPPLPIMLAKS